MAKCLYVTPDQQRGCQFNEFTGLPIPIYTFDGQEYCIFHAPLNYKDTWPESIDNGPDYKIPSRDAFVRLFAALCNIHWANFDGLVFPAGTNAGVALSSPNGHHEFSDVTLGREISLSFSASGGAPTKVFFRRAVGKGRIRIYFHGLYDTIAFFNCEFLGITRLFATSDDAIRVFHLRGSRFFDRLRVSMKTITHTVTLTKAQFYNPVDFLETQFPQNTVITGARFLAGAISPVSEGSYRHLRITLGEHKARDEEGTMYAVEQRCARKNYPVLSLRRVLSFLYGEFSEYGSSYSRALIWLAIIQCIALYVYSFVAYYSSEDIYKPMNTLILFVLTQLFKPFEILAAGSKDYYGGGGLFGNSAHAYLPYIAVSHSLFSLSIFALFLLALRRRFMRE